MNVIIAGGGPAGLITALTLSRRGIPCLVIEKSHRDTFLVDRGAAYDLSHSVLEMFEYFGLEQECKKRFQQFNKLDFYDVSGNCIRSLGLGNEVTYSVSRSELQRFLVEQLNAEIVDFQFGVSVVSFEILKENHEVCVTLEDGSLRYGSLLVGADGISSSVRNVLLEQLGDPISEREFSGVACWWGNTSLEGISMEAARAHAEGSYVVAIGKRLSYIGGICGDRVMWALMQRSGEVDLAEHQELGDAIRSVVESSGEKTVKLGIDDKAPISQWNLEGRVVLIGDAAHPMTPFLGMGANLAMIDAFILGSLVANDYYSKLEIGFADDLLEYESRRKAPIEALVLAARKAGTWMVPESGFKLWLGQKLLTLLPTKWVTNHWLGVDRVNTIDDFTGLEETMEQPIHVNQ